MIGRTFPFYVAIVVAAIVVPGAAFFVPPNPAYGSWLTRVIRE